MKDDRRKIEISCTNYTSPETPGPPQEGEKPLGLWIIRNRLDLRLVKILDCPTLVSWRVHGEEIGVGEGDESGWGGHAVMLCSPFVVMLVVRDCVAVIYLIHITV